MRYKGRILLVKEQLKMNRIEVLCGSFGRLIRGEIGFTLSMSSQQLLVKVGKTSLDFQTVMKISGVVHQYHLLSMPQNQNFQISPCTIISSVLYSVP